MANLLPNGRVYLSDLMSALAKTPPTAKAKRVEMLKEFVSRDNSHEKTLRGFAECMYHPGVVFDLPPGIPPFDKLNAVDVNTAPESMVSFFHKKRILYFANNPKKIPNPVKRERVFIQILESMHPKESDLLVAMKDKDDSKLKNFNEGLVRDAFPNWLPPEEPKNENAQK